jgi:hypothetical protein
MNLITAILYISGVLTITPALLYFSPHIFSKKIFHFEYSDDIADFFVRDWGLMVSIFGVLIILSVHFIEIRTAVLTAAAINKAAFVLLVFLKRKIPFVKGLFLSAYMDAVIVLLYLLIVAGVF